MQRRAATGQSACWPLPTSFAIAPSAGARALAISCASPSQFEGYYAPGEKAVQAQQNPQVRAEAEKILRGVLAGELKDPTQGADHFHAGGVNPDWASKMPATTRIGGHVFYNSQPGRNVAQAEQGTYEPGIEPRKYGYANGRGLANSVPEEKEPESGAVGSLSFVHQGQKKINPAFAAILTNVSGDIGRELVINSGYRSPQHPVEKAKGNGGGEHTHGTAAMSA
ncbi:cell wall hydrolase [Brucella abortus]|nr:cell wall hydrolase [Brucella abortus]